MAYCNNCGAYVADGFDQCPACGKNTHVNKNKKNDAWDIYEDNGIKGGSAAYKKQESASNYGQNSYSSNSYEQKKQEKPHSNSAASDEFRANEWHQYQNDRGTVYSGEVVNDFIPSNKRLLALCSYLQLLVLIPIFVDRNDSFVRFHINQGLGLLILGAISWILTGTFIFGIFSPLISILTAILAVMGIVNAIQGNQKELPIIGGIKILK